MSIPDTADLDKYLEEFDDLTESGDRGILKKVIQEGTTDIKPCSGDTVVVHYVGTYYGGEQHGVQFDSSRDRNEKFEFTIGKGDVIKAWDVGVATMKIGEICELIAAPDYAYKDDRTMKFVVELFDTRGMDVSLKKDGTIRKSILEKGRDILSPTLGLEVELNFRKFTDDADAFRNVSYTLGDHSAHDVPLCVDLAARHMNSSERCLVRMHDTSNSAEGSAGDVHNVGSMFEIKMISFEKAQHLTGLDDFIKQMEYADKMKQRANDFLKAAKYDLAISLYKRLDDDLQYLVANGVKEQKTLTEVTTAIHLNLALAYLKTSDAQSCTERCKKVLDIDASNEKALFRLGQACLLRKDHEDAAKYFERLVVKNPNNTLAVNQLRICRDTIQSAIDRERKIFRGIYERFKETGLGDVEETPAPVVNGAA